MDPLRRAPEENRNNDLYSKVLSLSADRDAALSTRIS